MNKRVFHIYRYISGVLLMAGLFGLQAADVIRKAAVAGQFYTANPSALKKEMETYFAGASQLQAPARLLVSPHAGYVFSGPVAGKGFAAIDKNVKKVIIIGPSHHALINGLAVTDATWYETPLGKVKVDQDLRDRLKKSPLVCSARGAEDPEHCIEVQLPFLQMKLGQFTFLPIITGRIDPAQAAELLFPLIDKETLVIASSDLSHYQHQKEARRIDDRSIETILSGDAMGFIDGCGETPVRIVMHLGRKMGLKPVKLDARTSFETAPSYGSESKVVGYASIAWIESGTIKKEISSEKSSLSPELKKYLLNLARESMVLAVKGMKPPVVDSVPSALKKSSGCFVTLTINGNLRGCIGYIEPIKPLYQAVIDNARSAALSDPRFSPVRQDELGKINVEVSVLSNPVPLEFKTPDDLLQKLKPGVHGVILQKGPYHSTFLPQVWEQLPDKIMFLEHLSMKGGMARDGWKTSEVRTYTAEHFQE
jgi:AmmeMemoRadiSam system protein B/AmmeMemoRadiSam system protein A